MSRPFLVLMAWLLLASSAAAQSQAQIEEVQRASAVGWDLYEHDQAAWHGTDLMLADIRDPRAEGMQGWITERTSDGVQVLFLRSEGDSVRAIYRALYRDGTVREHGRIDQPLSENQMRINRARLLAITAPLPQRCAEQYNIVVLPRAAPGPDGADVDVYIMPAQAASNEAPLGGHYRVAVDTNAGVVRETQRFTNSCLTIPFRRNTEGLVVSQILGDTPTEIHVFESLTSHRSIFVTARSGMWEVEGRDIHYVPN